LLLEPESLTTRRKSDITTNHAKPVRVNKVKAIGEKTTSQLIFTPHNFIIIIMIVDNIIMPVANFNIFTINIFEIC
jgi:hypothetical protein